MRRLRGAEQDGNRWSCTCGKAWIYVEDEAEGGAWHRDVEAWWVKTASLLAEKMRRGGVRKFRVELTPRGTYEFEVDPVDPADVPKVAPGGRASR